MRSVGGMLSLSSHGSESGECGSEGSLLVPSAEVEEAVGEEGIEPA